MSGVLKIPVSKVMVASSRQHERFENIAIFTLNTGDEWYIEYVKEFKKNSYVVYCPNGKVKGFRAKNVMEGIEKICGQPQISKGQVI